MIEELRSKHLNDMLNSTSSNLAYFGYKNHMIVIYDDDDPRISGLTIKGKTVKPFQMIINLLESLPEPIKKQVLDELKKNPKPEGFYGILMHDYFTDFK